MLERYVAQVRLLVEVFPDIAEESAFALKGGTAINLFYRDMPRLSVDGDITRLPDDDRASRARAVLRVLGEKGPLRGPASVTPAARIPSGQSRPVPARGLASLASLLPGHLRKQATECPRDTGCQTAGSA